jgi:hypothetical protein
MATAQLKLKNPTDLLGRTVTGLERFDGGLLPFYGVVEAVVIPAPGFTDHAVEFLVNGEYISVADCHQLDYAPSPLRH